MSETYDYILTGAGPGGCVLANRLTQDPNIRVLLLEAGRADTHPYIHMPVGFAKLTSGFATWGYETVPQAHVNNRRMPYAQGKILGGGSSINAQVYTRGNPRDYDAWTSDHGCPGWAHADVLPYFIRAEDNERFHNEFHGTGGPLGVSDQINPHFMTKAFLRASQEAGIPYNPDFNGATQEGCGIYQVTQRDGRRCSAAAAYLKPVRNRPNLTVITGALATRLQFEGRRCVGVEFARHGKGGSETARAEREVIVTSGAIGSPKLLMLSGIGPADHLKTLGIPVVLDQPEVGANLHDHINLYGVYETRGNFSYDKHTQLHKTLIAGIEYMLFGHGPVASNLAEGGAFVTVDPDSDQPDIQFHFMLGSGLEAGLKKLDNCGVTLNSANLRPRSRGTVRLASADPADAPLIDPNYWADPHDRAMSIAGFRLVREIMRQPAFEPYILAERLPGPDAQSDDDILAYGHTHAKTDYHPVSTCRMGSDDASVVDLELKVRGVDGLRVVDSSVMPRIPSSNTNAPTIMIAERGADFIRGYARLDDSGLASDRDGSGHSNADSNETTTGVMAP